MTPMSDTLKGLAQRVKAESGDGRELVRSPNDNPVCAITIDHDLKCLEIVWKRYATSAQFRFVHEWMLKLLVEHGLRNILGDDSAIPTIHAEDQTWIAHDWFPRARAAGLERAVSKPPVSKFALNAIEKLRAETPSGVTFRWFPDLDDARHWLRTA